MPPVLSQHTIEALAEAKRESDDIDFKEAFDPHSPAEWCELLKDFAALANSGGGAVIIGLRNDGLPSAADVDEVLKLDAAKIDDQLFKYSGQHVSGFDINEASRDGHRLAIITIDPVPVPIVFTRPGTYEIPGTGKQKTAFSQGVVYFRHSAKSEPATSADLADFVERQVSVAREVWLGNVRKVVEAPADAHIAVYRPLSSDAAGVPTQIQLTTDPNAPVFGRLDPDESHPHRMKELVQQINTGVGPVPPINSYDIQCVRKAHSIDEVTSPQFCHKPKYGSMQYSDAFVSWLREQYETNDHFFSDARAQCSIKS